MGCSKQWTEGVKERRKAEVVRVRVRLRFSEVRRLREGLDVGKAQC